jgi:hypothetical protein
MRYKGNRTRRCVWRREGGFGLDRSIWKFFFMKLHISTGENFFS